MLKDEMALFTELSGRDGEHTPIGVIGAYLDGYEKGKEEERQTGKWIPVSERLPKEEDYRHCYGFEDGCVIWQTDNGVVGFGWYYDSTKCWSDIYDHPIKTGKVIAWQPLPEQYKKGEE